MAENERGVVSALLITTSHNPSHFLRRVSKLLSYSLPLSKRINRGSLSLGEIRNFCWNLGIHKVIIVQGSNKINLISLCCYDFLRSPHQIDVKVKLANFHFPQKGQKETRVESKYISVEYTLDLPESLKDSIDNFIKPLLESTATKASKSNMKIKFKNYRNGKIHGEVLRAESQINTPLFSFEVITTKEVV